MIVDLSIEIVYFVWYNKNVGQGKTLANKSFP